MKLLRKLKLISHAKRLKFLKRLRLSTQCNKVFIITAEDASRISPTSATKCEFPFTNKTRRITANAHPLTVIFERGICINILNFLHDSLRLTVPFVRNFYTLRAETISGIVVS